MFTCAIYTRVSTKDQVSKGFSLDAQKKIGCELCERNKWQYKVFIEQGRSADKETLDNRPVLNEILDLTEDEKIQYLFVTELDRLSRNPITLAYIKKILSENDVKVVTPSQTFDFRDDEDDFLSDLLGILAKRENRLRVKRSRRAKTEAVKLGRWVGSTLPYGWMKQPCKDDRLKHNQLIPHPEESKIYLQMVEWSMRGLGTNSIAQKLNELNIPTRFTKQSKNFIWKAGTVFRILKNPIYKGDYIYGEGIAKIKSIISPEKWHQLQENLKSNYNNADRNTRKFYLLRGLLICKKCGQRLYGLIKPSRKMRCYCCLSKRPDPHPRFCGLKNVPLDSINNYVWNVINNIIVDSSEIKRAVIEQQEKTGDTESQLKIEIDKTNQQINTVDRQAGKLLDLYTQSEFSVEDLNRKAAEFKKRRDDLKRYRNELSNKLTNNMQEQQSFKYLENYILSIKKRINQFNDQEKYDLLHLLINKVIIDYDNKKNIHTFDIEFVLNDYHSLQQGSRYCSNTISGVRFAITGQIYAGQIR